MADPWFDPGYKWTPTPHNALKGQKPWDYHTNTKQSDWRQAPNKQWIYRGPQHPLGNKPPGGGPSPPPGFGDLPDLFQPDKYPKSGSYSGLPEDYRDMVAGRAIPLLLNTVEKLPGQIDKYESDSLGALGSEFDASGADFQQRIMAALQEIDKYNKLAARSYQKQGQRAIGNMLPDVLNNLANRNVLQSSVASDTIGTAAAEIVKEYSQKGYESAMQTAQQRFGLKQHEADKLLELAVSKSGALQETRTHAMDLRQQLPGIMSTVGALANYSESFSENPLAPYELLANFVMNY